MVSSSSHAHPFLIGVPRQVSIDDLLIRSMGQGVVEQMLYQKLVLISRTAELNKIGRHASPHPKKTLKHTIFLSKRIDADQRCGASHLHLELKFAGVTTWSSGADLEATKRGSHKLRRAGRSCSLIGAPRAQPFDQVVLGLGATSLRFFGTS